MEFEASAVPILVVIGESSKSPQVLMSIGSDGYSIEGSVASNLTVFAFRIKL